MEILIKNIKQLLQVRETNIKKLTGQQMGHLPVLENAYLKIKDGLIDGFGTMESCPEPGNGEVIDAANKIVSPSYVDSHTHLVFAASREEEFVYKIKGMSYAEIAARGGGILNSAGKLQNASEDGLLESALKRAKEIIKFGTGAVEIKSGYGLTVEDELKMLRVGRRIGRETPLTVKTTFLGAHAVPKETTKSEYLKLVIEEMIPAVAEEGLASYIDAFCEEGFFSVEETEAVMEAGKKYGLIPKIHANQLNRSGGVQVGVKVGALSVDHLESIGEEEIECLKDGNTMATLLPGAAFFLGTTFPPARDMIDADLSLALATDYNPGSAPSGNMSFMASLACIRMKMTPEEVFNAATINGAYAMGISHSHASITKGKVANVFITKEIPSYTYIPYAYASNQVEQVILNGKIIGE